MRDNIGVVPPVIFAIKKRVYEYSLKNCYYYLVVRAHYY